MWSSQRTPSVCVGPGARRCSLSLSLSVWFKWWWCVAAAAASVVAKRGFTALDLVLLPPGLFRSIVEGQQRHTKRFVGSDICVWSRAAGWSLRVCAGSPPRLSSRLLPRCWESAQSVGTAPHSTAQHTPPSPYADQPTILSRTQRSYTTASALLVGRDTLDGKGRRALRLRLYTYMRQPFALFTFTQHFLPCFFFDGTSFRSVKLIAKNDLDLCCATPWHLDGKRSRDTETLLNNI